MGFTTPCFIRKNTPELRKKLAKLGYKYGYRADFRHDIMYVDAERDEFFPTFSSNITDDEIAIDCGTNEELFLAIAALRDDTNYMQWFVCTSDYKESDGKEWKVGDFDLNTCPDDFDNILPHWRKATVNELIEHFKDKKEQLCVE